jgi:hypothetical protein
MKDGAMRSSRTVPSSSGVRPLPAEPPALLAAQVLALEELVSGLLADLDLAV